MCIRDSYHAVQLFFCQHHTLWKFRDSGIPANNGCPYFSAIALDVYKRQMFVSPIKRGVVYFQVINPEDGHDPPKSCQSTVIDVYKRQR